MLSTVLPVLLIAYLFGSVPVGVLVARTYNLDLQKVGSGNTGATNVLRAVGWGPAIVVALADILKGGLGVLIAAALQLPHWMLALVAFAAVIGHNWSIFLGFRGGKGVAASYGTILLLDVGLGLAVLPIFIVTVLATRFVSAGSIVGGFSSIVLAIAMQREWWKILMCAGLALMIAFKHRDNLARMYEGTERRIDQRTPKPVAPDAPVPVPADTLEPDVMNLKPDAAGSGAKGSDRP